MFARHRFGGTKIVGLELLFALRFILIGERFFRNFQSLEVIGDMYQYTEAFCHYSWNSPEPKISSSLRVDLNDMYVLYFVFS